MSFGSACCGASPASRGQETLFAITLVLTERRIGPSRDGTRAPTQPRACFNGRPPSRPVCNQCSPESEKSWGFWGQSPHSGMTSSFFGPGMAPAAPSTKRRATAVRHSRTRR